MILTKKIEVKGFARTVAINFLQYWLSISVLYFNIFTLVIWYMAQDATVYTFLFTSTKLVSQ